MSSTLQRIYYHSLWCQVKLLAVTQVAEVVQFAASICSRPHTAQTMAWEAVDPFDWPIPTMHPLLCSTPEYHFIVQMLLTNQSDSVGNRTRYLQNTRQAQCLIGHWESFILSERTFKNFIRKITNLPRAGYSTRLATSYLYFMRFQHDWCSD